MGGAAPPAAASGTAGPAPAAALPAAAPTVAAGATAAAAGPAAATRPPQPAHAASPAAAQPSKRRFRPRFSWPNHPAVEAAFLAAYVAVEARSSEAPPVANAAKYDVTLQPLLLEFQEEMERRGLPWPAGFDESTLNARLKRQHRKEDAARMAVKGMSAVAEAAAAPPPPPLEVTARAAVDRPGAAEAAPPPAAAVAAGAAPPPPPPALPAAPRPPPPLDPFWEQCPAAEAAFLVRATAFLFTPATTTTNPVVVHVVFFATNRPATHLCVAPPECLSSPPFRHVHPASLQAAVRALSPSSGTAAAASAANTGVPPPPPLPLPTAAAVLARIAADLPPGAERWWHRRLTEAMVDARLERHLAGVRLSEWSAQVRRLLQQQKQKQQKQQGGGAGPSPAAAAAAPPAASSGGGPPDEGEPRGGSSPAPPAKRRTFQLPKLHPLPNEKRMKPPFKWDEQPAAQEAFFAALAAVTGTASPAAGDAAVAAASRIKLESLWEELQRRLEGSPLLEGLTAEVVRTKLNKWRATLGLKRRRPAAAEGGDGGGGGPSTTAGKDQAAAGGGAPSSRRDDDDGGFSAAPPAKKPKLQLPERRKRRLPERPLFKWRKHPEADEAFSAALVALAGAAAGAVTPSLLLGEFQRQMEGRTWPEGLTGEAVKYRLRNWRGGLIKMPAAAERDAAVKKAWMRALRGGAEAGAAAAPRKRREPQPRGDGLADSSSGRSGDAGGGACGGSWAAARLLQRHPLADRPRQGCGRRGVMRGSSRGGRHCGGRGGGVSPSSLCCCRRSAPGSAAADAACCFGGPHLDDKERGTTTTAG